MRCFRLGLVIVGLSLAVFAADSPFSGNWKFRPGKKDTFSSTATVQADDQHLALDQQIVEEKGQSRTLKFDAKFDGKDYPVSGDPDFNSVSLHRVNDHRIQGTWKKDGKKLMTNDVSVSQDGKTTTVTFTDYRGKTPRKNTDVYDKQ